LLGGAPRVQATEIASAWYAENLAPVTSATSEFHTLLSGTIPGVQVSEPLAWVYLAGADGELLVPGTYSGSSPQTPGVPFFMYNWLGCPNSATTFTVAEATYAPDGTFASLAVDFQAACTGDGWLSKASGSLRFHSTAPVRALVASPEGVDVGDVSTAEPVSRTITIQNVGTTATTVSSLVIEGFDASSWGIANDGCSGTTVAASASCTVDVVAQPLIGGDLQAELDILSDAFASPLRAANLRAHGRIATTLALSIPGGQPTVGNSFYLAATATPAPDDAFVDMWIDNDSIYVGRFYFVHVAVAEGVVLPLAPGPHHARATFYSMSGNATPASATLDFTVGDTTATTLTLSKSTTYSDQPVTINANLTGPSGLTGGTLTIRDYTTSEVLATVGATPAIHTLTVSRKFAAGDHYIIAEYSGAPGYAPSGQGLDLNVIADNGVALLGTTPTYQTFYPYRDGYKDTVKVGGTLDEPATVAVAIYRPSGGRIVSTKLGWKTGVYRYTWNGRSSSGTMFPAGKYKVVQTLHDATGHARSVTSYVTISAKRLYTYSTYLNKTTPTKRTASWIGWQFSLPAATIYKSLVFQVYGRSVLIPGASLGGWDIRRCAWTAPWSPGCVEHWATLGFTTGWHSQTLSPTYNRSSRYVRGFAATDYGSGVVYKVRLKVVYGILR
jgi:hypothetical protein